MRLVIIIISFVFVGSVHGQTTKTWEDFVNYILDNEETGEDETWAQNLEDYEALHLHPIAINTSSKTELLQIPFIDEQQATDIRDYIALHGQMKTLSELIFIPSISYVARSFLPLFIYVDANNELAHKSLSLKEMLGHQEHELSTRFDIPLYYRKGYMAQNGYRGSPLYNKSIYRFSATSHIDASLRMERDGGERGIDSYGGQVMLRDMGHIETLVAGDYKVGFGEGLVANQGFSLGKTTLFTRPRRGIRAHNGTDEYNFLRGMGVDLRWGHFGLSTFVSHRTMDATLQGDTCIHTILKSGLHRTESEWQRKDNVQFTSIGAHLSWQTKRWEIGTTATHLYTSLPLVRGTELYRQIAPEGQHFTSIGVDYSLHSYRWNLHGETAFHPQQTALATLNTIEWLASPRYTLSFSQRYYDKSYYSFLARSLCENTNVQNESAVTLRLAATPIDGMEVTSYLDFFHNAWPRYGLKSSSQGIDFMLTTSYNLNRHNTISARYNIKSKEDSKGRQIHHRLQLLWTGQLSERISTKSTISLHTLAGKWGEAISQTIRYKTDSRLPLQISASLAYFHTDDYYTRIYLVEPTLTQSAMMPTLYGHGLRMTGVARFDFWKRRLRLELKYGLTRYFDRDTQGSGMQTIYGNAKNDIAVQVRMRL